MEEQEEEERTGQETGGSLTGFLPTASVTQGEAGTRPADSRGHSQWKPALKCLCASFVNENASVFRKVKLRLFLIFAFQLRHSRLVYTVMDFIATPS